MDRFRSTLSLPRSVIEFNDFDDVDAPAMLPDAAAAPARCCCGATRWDPDCMTNEAAAYKFAQCTGVGMLLSSPKFDSKLQFDFPLPILRSGNLLILDGGRENLAWHLTRALNPHSVQIVELMKH